MPGSKHVRSLPSRPSLRPEHAGRARRYLVAFAAWGRYRCDDPGLGVLRGELGVGTQVLAAWGLTGWRVA